MRNCVNKFNNLDKIDKFLGGYKLPKLTQEEVENLNRAITSKEVEFVIKNRHSEKHRPRCLIFKDE